MADSNPAHNQTLDLKLPPYTPRHLKRTEQHPKWEHSPRQVEYADMTSLSLRKESTQKKNEEDFSLPPVPTPRLSKEKRSMGNILTYSRHSKEIMARMKKTPEDDMYIGKPLKWTPKKPNKLAELNEAERSKMSCEEDVA
ncbi:hypothetical protein CAPTEDRAFT_214554 [Capitella teleta]|uniref:Uncharacterized protein n=1 Tax=Capitella teleta TaxID=283909 RepID=R7TB15_CAPTE|nr:hypothetical protein CAPTEDRAFT_214554 [Capitella teleta]|eukprot:ELT90889.1 hypothetical protein CAPTEDRAFT_214554 [Capitella teleta]